jgi:ribonuclease P protein component
MMPAKNLSFPKNRRLTRQSEFELVKQRGRAERGPLLIVSALVAESGRKFRAGFVTSRRIGGAVVRNRVRRRLREIVRKHQHRIIDGTWVVTIALAPATCATFRALEHEWLRLAKRTSILPP